MNRENARNYLRSSGMSEEQIAEIESAFTCEDAISRQAVLDVINTAWTIDDLDNLSNVMITDMIKELPSVSTEKTGRWIDREVYDADRWKCSECGRTEPYRENYCPNCGARMGVEE